MPKTITRVPPLSVTAFLFPDRPFRTVGKVGMCFRARMEGGEAVVEWHLPNLGWVPIPPRYRKFVEKDMSTGMFGFVEPVEIEDD